MGIITETNFFGDLSQTDEPKVLIIPTPYEYTTSYCKGTKNGPQAVLNASTKLEFFDDELWLNHSSVGINTSSFVNCEFANNKTTEPFTELEQAVRNAVISGILPVVLGGEHSISFGSIKAIYDLYPDVSVLHFDAHANLKSSYKNNKYSNQSVLRQIHDTMPDIKVVQVGIRNISKEETEWLESQNPGIEILFARDRNRWNITDILTNLTKNVYITFDFSVFDSAIMPSCSNPEPGGLSFEQITDILKNICAFKDVVGMDFVEFSPIPGLNAPDYLASKLIYKTIGYTFARQLGVIEENENTVSSIV